MNNFSKMLVGSSLVLGAVLFSVGCGGDSFCCKDGEPPIPKIAGNAKTISIEGTTKHTFTGLQDAGKDDGSVVKCKWYIDGKLQSYTNNECANVELNFAGMSGKPEVCLEVIDNEGLSSTLNNGKIEKDDVGASAKTPENSPIELRKKMDCKYVAITSIAGPDPVAKISVSNPTFMPGCPLATAADAGSTPGEGTITNYAWTLDGAEINDGATETSLKYTDMEELSAGDHKVCLVATNSLGSKSKESCETITVKEHVAPTAVLNISSTTSGEVIAEGEAPNGTILKNSKIKLSCTGSHDDCPITEGGRSIPTNGTCKFGGVSYLSDNGDCSTVDTIYKDCSKQGEGDYDAHFGAVSNNGADVNLQICGTTTNFKCVKLWVDVTDKFGGTNRAEKTFNVK